jgi:uncharacterized DUF497 family protein
MKLKIKKGNIALTHYLNIKKFSYIKSYHADWKHNVQKEEAAEVFDNEPIYRRSRSEQGIIRYLGLGETYEGRLLVVVYEIVNANEVLIITAREMTSIERRQYFKIKGE